mmetsp:Transcript_1245/g.1277  ORF Transcript_1245/g.1277 Transcript_1245/m.1277 type:complete len:102 (+) Transcript_1245:224-529(+)
MSVGGNKNFQEYLQQYDLAEESFESKYQSKAVAYYIKKLDSLAYGLIFKEPKLPYEEGRVQTAPPPEEAKQDPVGDPQESYMSSLFGIPSFSYWGMELPPQ